MTTGVTITDYDLSLFDKLAREVEALDEVEDASRDLLKHLDCSLLRDTPLICILRDALRNLDEVRSGI